MIQHIFFVYGREGQFVQHQADAGLRALQYIAEAMKDKYLCLVLVDAGILGFIMDYRFIETMMIPQYSVQSMLIFTIFESSALDSSIKLKIR